jgi:hypothetical protein
MSVSNAQSHDCADKARPPLVRVQELLEEVLQLLDEYETRPELGARVQDIINALKSPAD